MAKPRELEQCDAVDQGQRDARHILIGKQVLNGLGEPGDLLQIQVRPLWDQHYRVNIVVGADIVSARVANSYFLKANEDGNIVASTPTIKRQYGRATESPPLPAGSAGRT